MLAVRRMDRRSELVQQSEFGKALRQAAAAKAKNASGLESAGLAQLLCPPPRVRSLPKGHAISSASVLWMAYQPSATYPEFWPGPELAVAIWPAPGNVSWRTRAVPR